MKEISMSKFVVLAVILVVVSGCASIAPHQTIEELSTLRNKKLEAATHKFNDTKEQDVEKAIVKVFNLLDGNDVKFDLRTNKILVSRWWTFYAVFNVGFGKDFWEFKIKEAGNGTEVTAAFDAEANTGMFAAPVSTDFKENIGIGGNMNVGASIADYDLLYSRVEYILGNNKAWPTCDDIATKHNVGKNTMVLCGRIGIDDKRPE